MKPENILIDNKGYAILTDFGLSKDNLEGDNLTKSFCGTTEYLAPEVIKSKHNAQVKSRRNTFSKSGYGFSCDWWSFGCVLYEMLTGVPPFYDKNKLAIYDKIQHSQPSFYDFHSS